MYKRLASNTTVLTTVLAITSTVAFSTSTSAQTFSKSYYSRINLRQVLRQPPPRPGKPIVPVPFNVGAQVFGRTYATGAIPNADDHDNYSFSDEEPSSILLKDVARSTGNYASAFATSTAIGQLLNPITTSTTNSITLKSTTITSGYAFASVPPDKSFTFASAESSARVFGFQRFMRAPLSPGEFPGGTLDWPYQTIYWDYSSNFNDGEANARYAPLTPVNFVDSPGVKYKITDSTTQNVLRTGKLLDVSTSFDAGSIQWGVADNSGNFGDGSTPPPEDDKLDIDFANNGSFTIDLTDPAVINPGLFQVEAKEGKITDIKTTGRFATLTGLPSVGDRSTFSIPFSSAFPKEIPVDYAFTDLNDGNPFDITYEYAGGGAAVAAPEPLTILGSATAVGFGAFFKRKRKLSESSEKENTKDS